MNDRPAQGRRSGRRTIGEAGWWQREGPPLLLLIMALLIGVTVWAVARLSSWWFYAPAAALIAGGLVYLAGTWGQVLRWTDPEATRTHARINRPFSRNLSEVVVVVASLASLVGVGYVLLAVSKHGAEMAVASGVGVAAVVVAWFSVHTVFSLRYAHMYYRRRQTPSAAIDFHDFNGGVQIGDPEHGARISEHHPHVEDLKHGYRDFFYLGFTIGMTYQVSDTSLCTPDIRSVALRQALLSYLLGAVILAITINLVASLSH